MPNIDIKEPFAIALVQRLQKEYGDLAGANLAQDIIINAQNEQIQALVKQLEDAQQTISLQGQKIDGLSRDNNELKNTIDPTRGNRFDGYVKTRDVVTELASDEFQEILDAKSAPNSDSTTSATVTSSNLNGATPPNPGAG